MAQEPLMSSSDLVLEIRDLKTVFRTEEGLLPALDGVSFGLKKGRTLALVGESGCGKSVTAYSVLGLQSPGRITGGQVLFRDREGIVTDLAALTKTDEKALYDVRGGKITMIFQEPMTALSPVHTIGDQIGEGLRLHRGMTKKESMAKAAEMLATVGIPAPEKRVEQYPHELSGGMRQRAMIALALITKPVLLIADEPTTALDVTIQAQVLGLMKDLQKEFDASVLLITHDLGVVAQQADEVCVMYLGRIVESGSVRQVIKTPRHPYTKGLLRSLPSVNEKGRKLYSIEGSVPRLSEIPSGCPFHPRCEYSKPGLCDAGGPPVSEAVAEGHTVACLRAREI